MYDWIDGTYDVTNDGKRMLIDDVIEELEAQQKNEMRIGELKDEIFELQQQIEELGEALVLILPELFTLRSNVTEEKLKNLDSAHESGGKRLNAVETIFDFAAHYHKEKGLKNE